MEEGKRKKCENDLVRKILPRSQLHSTRSLLHTPRARFDISRVLLYSNTLCVYELSGSHPVQSFAIYSSALSRRSMVLIGKISTLLWVRDSDDIHDQVRTLPSVQWSSSHDPGLAMTESLCDHSNCEGRVFLVSSTSGLVPASRDTNNERTTNI